MLPEISEEIAHVVGIPKKLIIFLHGYYDNAVMAEDNIFPLIERLNDCAVHIPQSPQISEIKKNMRQWYSMYRFDPRYERKTVPNLADCLPYYDKMLPGFQESFAFLNPYIDNCLAEYGLEDKDLYITGFSQGAMLALYTALMRDEPVAGCISFSGLMAPYTFLTKHYKSRPDVLLIHGNKDDKLRFDCCNFTKEKLQLIGCQVKVKEIDNGHHMITPEALDAAYDFINTSLIKKVAI